MATADQHDAQPTRPPEPQRIVTRQRRSWLRSCATPWRINGATPMPSDARTSRVLTCASTPAPTLSAGLQMTMARRLALSSNFGMP